jgi:hypothetical protein
MTEKLREAVRWILQKNAGEFELDRADFMEILQQADKGHRKRFGRPIFAENIDLDGLNCDGDLDAGRCYGWTLDADEKRFLSKSHSFLTS